MNDIGVFIWHFLFLFTGAKFTNASRFTPWLRKLLLEERRKRLKSEVSIRHIMYYLGVAGLKLKNFPFF